MRSTSSFLWRRLGGLAITVAVCLGAQATRAETGFTWMVDRHTIKVEDDGRWVALVEGERKAHDVQAAREGGRIDISYQASTQKIEIVEAVTIKADGRRLPVAADRIVDIAPQVGREVALYTDLRTRSIVYPDLETGDSVRFVYRLTAVEAIWPGWSLSTGWLGTARTSVGERIIERPAGRALAETHQGVGYRVESGPDGVRQIFSWKNSVIVPAEAGSTAGLDWAPGFTISTFASYAEAGDHYGRLHAAAASLTPEIEALAAEIAGATTDKAGAARLLYDWTRRNVRYVAVMVGQGKLQPVEPLATVRNRYGDCKAQVALLAALLSARGIASEAVMMNLASARYVLPKVPSLDFDHVILYVPALDLYLDPTAQHASFGVLSWSHYDKPALHAVVGKSRTVRLPRARAEDNLVETHTTVTMAPDGRMTGTTREMATGAMAVDLRNQALRTETARAVAQLRLFGTPGTGKWTRKPDDKAGDPAVLVGQFTLLDAVDLPAGEALTPPAGLRFLSRPGAFLLGTHDTARLRPFPCYAGRQVETIEVTVPAGLRPTRLPADRTWTLPIAEYRSSYTFSDGTLRVKREFTAHPEGQVCTPEQSKALVGFLSNLRRDYRAVVVFDDKP